MTEGAGRGAPAIDAVAVWTGPVRQVALPSLGQLVRSNGETCFAHPAERHLADLLSFYGVRWSYEPTSFALSRLDDDGPRAFFTPDFYLPEHRLYIELTTMRQRLVTRKNRKLRRLRELYPAVGIKLLYRRDYQWLVAAYERPNGGTDQDMLERVLYSPEAIAQRVDALAGEIAVDAARTGSDPPLLLGVGPGSGRFLTDLTAAVDACGLAVDHDRIELTRYGAARCGRRARVQRPPEQEVAGRHIVLVEDVVNTGLSLAFLQHWLRRHGVKKVTACTLLDRSASRLVPVPLQYVGFAAPPAMLAGYGLALRRRFSDLPYIAALAPEPCDSPSI